MLLAFPGSKKENNWIEFLVELESLIQFLLFTFFRKLWKTLRFVFLHFRGEWRKWTPYDMEVSDLRDRLTEYPLAFPPTYPFVEDPKSGSSYMRTRCPAWCDRVLMSHQAKSLINDQDDNSAITYDVIGKDVCMGDHKPVFLRCKLKLTSNNLPRRPRVESPSYTDLLNSPPPTSTTSSNNGGCSRFMELKDSVKLFKETTV